jgi:hypothetical protein
LHLGPGKLPLLKIPVEILASLFLLLGFAVKAIGVFGPFVRKIVARSLNRTVSTSGGWVTSRVTASKVRRILLQIRQQMSLLDPKFVSNDPIIAEGELSIMRDELSSLRLMLTG